MKKNELIYLAGLFDGEGNVYIAKGGCRNTPTKKYWLRLTITNTNKKILAYIKKYFGGQLFNNGNFKKSHHKLCWFWVLSCNQAKEFLEKIYPYLRIKKKVVGVAIDFQKNMKRCNGYIVDKKELNRRIYYREKIKKLNL